ncbi:hypothetical protein HCN44_007288 [Aphidius gifuensis]|uniref:Vacuolar fusion protein CCZ1 n=1 Tax=Aphidius gifuensis TaxID=684658 RepID=A0A834XKP5_APHGI|nr:vacuolar fusion protein CCZ1 homolog [Aphidius gifuensis]KAF7988978.1 hypothetical protein HCN44_007288 [Aphidius gifuensis]
MTSKPEITLDHFYIFNGTYAKKEGDEDKKILYYYPEKTDIDSKIKNIGLSEAIIKFTESFNPGKSCEFCHTHKTRQIFYEPEPDFWIVMIVGVPFLRKLKDGVEYVEYYNEEVSNEVCQAIVKQAYMQFRLFMGSFETILDDPNCGSPTLLRHKLDYFFSDYLFNLKLNHRDILDVYQGLQYLPLDKTTFLEVQCFMNKIKATLPQVKNTIFLYDNQLVWSDLELEDTQVIYNYLTSTPITLNAHPDDDLSCNKFVKRNNNPGEQIGITPKSPKVFINHQTKPTSLVVYNALNSTICLFVDSNTSIIIEYLQNLNTIPDLQFLNVINSIVLQSTKNNTRIKDSDPKYLYFNSLNLAYKSTMHLTKKLCPELPTTSEVLRVIIDINNDIKRMNEAGEIVIKTMSGYWIVGKLSNSRIFFAVIQNNNAHFIEIDDEVKNLCNEQLKSIFFQK